MEKGSSGSEKSGRATGQDLVILKTKRRLLSLTCFVAHDQLQFYDGECWKEREDELGEVYREVEILITCT
jgi:hypothetical protein